MLSCGLIVNVLVDQSCWSIRPPGAESSPVPTWPLLRRINCLVVLERFLPTLIHLADSHRRFADLFGRRNRSVVVLLRLPGIVVILMLQFSVGVSSAVGSSFLQMNTCVQCTEVTSVNHLDSKWTLMEVTIVDLLLRYYMNFDRGDQCA